MQSQNDAQKTAEDQTDAASEPEAEAAADAAAEALAAAEGAAAAQSIDDAGADLAAELEETKDRLLRALAEAENVRRRAQRDVENVSKRAIAGFAREMIIVADNLSRALASVDAKAAEQNEALKSLLTGVEMTAREMHNAFERNSIKKIDPLGARFDPQVHEAMFEFEDPSKPTGTVGQVLEPGYTLHGQPLRPAKVGVTKGGPKPDAAPTPSPATVADAEKDRAGGSGGKAYEDKGASAGGHLDEEL